MHATASSAPARDAVSRHLARCGAAVTNKALQDLRELPTRVAINLPVVWSAEQGGLVTGTVELLDTKVHFIVEDRDGADLAVTFHLPALVGKDVFGRPRTLMRDVVVFSRAELLLQLARRKAKLERTGRTAV